MSPRTFVLAVLLISPLALSACGNTNDVVGIDFTVSEFPGGGKVPWSCIAQGPTDGPGAEAIVWTVGAPVVVTSSARFERACGGWMGSPCPDPEMVIEPLDATVWTVAMGPTPGSMFGPYGRYLEAIAPGAGGVKVTAQGHPFPPLTLHAVAPSSFRFFRVPEVTGMGPTMEPIDRLTLAKGEQVTIVPQLVTATGARLCGFATMVVKATGPSVSPDPTWNPDGRANGPLRVTGADAGKIDVSAAGASATLMVNAS
jgi:hypothetical protein